MKENNKSMMQCLFSVSQGSITKIDWHADLLFLEYALMN
jgi:hypothetical protein